jgi:hypothetical protein
MKLFEALEHKKIAYKGSRPNYKIHDGHPNVLIIDPDYSYDGHGKSILGMNLNYLDQLTEKQKKQLIAKVNKIDATVINMGAIKTWLRTLFNRGDYDGLTVDKKIERYRKMVKNFPELKKVIRRYKYSAIV